MLFLHHGSISSGWVIQLSWFYYATGVIPYRVPGLPAPHRNDRLVHSAKHSLKYHAHYGCNRI
jgi:hypothetical protein